MGVLGIGRRNLRLRLLAVGYGWHILSWEASSHNLWLAGRWLRLAPSDHPADLPFEPLFMLVFPQP